MIKPRKLDEKIVKGLMERHGDELTAFITYRSMSNYLKNVGFFKAAEYFKGESDDELTHARMIEDFLTAWNVMPTIAPVEKAPVDFKGLVDCIEKAYKLELDLYDKYEELSGDILSEDTAVFDFLKKFRKIQTQSVAEYSDMINLLSLLDTSNKFEVLYAEERLFSK